MKSTLLSSLAIAVIAWGASASGQTITVDTYNDTVDVNWQTATIADLPGPDGRVSLPEALIATNHTAGHQTIAFAIPMSEWTFQFLYPGRAVIVITNSFFMHADETVTIDATTQTAFTGDTNPDGAEVVIYGADLRMNGNNQIAIGFDSSSIAVNGSNSLVQACTGTTNISLFGGANNLIEGNRGGTIKIDRSNGNVVIGNTVARVRVLGFNPTQPALNNRIGGPDLTDRNFITGYGTWNSEGLPAGTTVQLFDTTGTIVQNNWIGTTPDGLAQGSQASTTGVGLEGMNFDLTVRDNLIAGILGHGMGPHHAGQLFGLAVVLGGSGSGIDVLNNTIGLDATGSATLGSVWGIDAGDTWASTVSDIRIEGNTVAGHILNGVTVGRTVSEVRLTKNEIYANGWLGIDLIPSTLGYGVSMNDALDVDTGGNGVQNFPVIASAKRQGNSIRIKGSFQSQPSSLFTLEFFASSSCDPSGFGEGERSLGTASVTTNGAGDASFDVAVTPAGGMVSVGSVITSTATLEPIGATSEFSACVALDEQFCQDDLGSGGPGDSVLSLCGQSLDSGNVATLSLIQATPTSPAMFVIGTQNNPTPFLDGVLVPVPFLITPVLFTNALGQIEAPVPGGGGPATLYMQVVSADPTQAFGVEVSNAIRIVLGP